MQKSWVWCVGACNSWIISKISLKYKYTALPCLEDFSSLRAFDLRLPVNWNPKIEECMTINAVSDKCEQNGTRLINSTHLANEPFTRPPPAQFVLRSAWVARPGLVPRNRDPRVGAHRLALQDARVHFWEARVPSWITVTVSPELICTTRPVNGGAGQGGVEGPLGVGSGPTAL